MTGIMPRPRGPMIKDAPDHHDADLVLRLYELRREATMREARRYLATEFWPAVPADLLAVTKPDHPGHTPFRHAEWLATQCDMGRELFAHSRQRVEKALAARRGA